MKNKAFKSRGRISHNLIHIHTHFQKENWTEAVFEVIMTSKFPILIARKLIQEAQKTPN